MDIDIRSRGCDDPGKPSKGCGATFIKVYGKNYAPRKKGHNIVIVDAKTGTIVPEDSLIKRAKKEVLVPLLRALFKIFDEQSRPGNNVL